MKYFIFIIIIFCLLSCNKRSYLILKESEQDICYKKYTQDYQIDTVNAFLEDSFLLKRFSKSSLILANTYSMIDEIRAYKKIQKRLLSGKNDDKTILYKVYYENEIDQKMDQASFELQGLSSSIRCEILRLSKIASDLQNSNNKTQTNITNAAILVGTLSSVLVAGILISKDEALNNSDAKDWIGVAGGVIATYLAIKSSRTTKKIAVSHKRNIIKTVWGKSNSQDLFYPTLWYLMNSNETNGSEDGSSLDHISRNWESLVDETNEIDDKAVFNTLLNTGGVYDSELLKLRINLLLEIENGVDILYQSFFLLNQELQKTTIKK